MGIIICTEQELGSLIIVCEAPRGGWLRTCGKGSHGDFAFGFFSPLVLILGNPLSLAFSKDYSLATLLKISLTFFSLSQSKEATKSVDFAEVSWGSKESKNIECKSYL